ncbi:Natural Cytotoxicity Triggering Receptor 3 Ligand 1 [Manis pentadactyla]|nr:Natural Cytotoxicity Triggering Receptor 3 Ligand 1 [Manis pentadactyla]
MPTRDMEKYPLDGTLNPNTPMQLYIFCKQTDPETLEKEKTDPFQHSLPPMPTRDMEKYPLDGTLNPNTLMQLYIFCKQVGLQRSHQRQMQLAYSHTGNNICTQDTENHTKPNAWPSLK